MLSIHVSTSSPKTVMKDVHRFWPHRSEEEDKLFCFWQMAGLILAQFPLPFLSLLVSTGQWPSGFNIESFLVCSWWIKDSRDVVKSLTACERGRTWSRKLSWGQQLTFTPQALLRTSQKFLYLTKFATKLRSHLENTKKPASFVIARRGQNDVR